MSKPRQKPSKPQVVLSEKAQEASTVIKQYYQKCVQRRGMNRHEQMITSQAFVNGLCAMIQLNQLRLSKREAAMVFTQLKPIFDKLSHE